MTHLSKKHIRLTLIASASLLAMSATAAEYHFGPNSSPNYNVPDEVTFLSVYAPTDEATAHAGNTVFVNNIRAGAGVLGGYAVTGNDVHDNRVVIEAGQVTSGVDGAISVETDAHDNTVEVTGDSLVWGVITGGTSMQANAFNNSVIIEDQAEIKSTIHAGQSTQGGDAYSNMVDIRGGDFSDFQGYIAGGTSFGGSAYSNEVHIRTTTDTWVYGGQTFASADLVDEDTRVSDNLVYVHEDGAVSGAVAGRSSEGKSWGVAIENNLIVVDGTAGQVIAADRYSLAGNINSETDTAETHGNRIEVSGTVTEQISIFRGTIHQSADMPEYTGTVNVSNNEVVINEGADISQADVVLCDINIQTDEMLQTRIGTKNANQFNVNASNNTLVVNKWQGDVKSIADFDRWDVRVGDNVDPNKAIITAGSVTLPESGLSSLSLTLSDQALPAYQQSGQSLTILDADQIEGILIGENTEQIIKSESGFLFADAEFDAATGTLDVSKLHATDKSVGYFEGLTAMLSMTSQAADLVAGSALKSSMDKISLGGISAIGVMDGSSYRVQTGSSINVKGFSALAGVGGKFAAGSGALDVAGFVEFGHSTFDTVSAFDSSGNGEYYGLGALARWTADCGFFAEGSVRFGWLDADFDGESSTGGYGQNAMYYGAHAGLGWGFDMGSLGKTEVFGQYFYTKQKFDDMKVAGVEMSADDADSSRTRLGARYTYSGDSVEAWVIAAWDLEFDGETGGKVMSVSVDAPSLEGNSAVGETGVTFGGANSPWSVSARVGGYVGDRDGVYGGLTAAYRF